MTEKRITDIWCNEMGHIGFTYDGVDLTFQGDSLETFLNELVDENEQLKKEKEELLDKLLECQKALSRKNIREEPHWYKYGNNEGYTAKNDLDIRF